MPNIEQLQAVMTGTESNRIEALRRMLAYPVKQKLDPEGSRFWYLRPGADKLQAADTLPIAVGFYPELNEATQPEIVKFLTSKEQPSGIYEHYLSRANPENRPVMYILLPEKERTGRVALILPTEGGLRQRQIQTFAWNEQELLGRLSRLEQGRLPIAIKRLNLIPLVEWVFYEAAKTAQELARELAKVTRRMEQAISHVYDAEDGDGYLRKLFVSFKRELLPTLEKTSTNEKDYSFADIYAQTIAYGLFTARVFSYVKDEKRGQDKETYFNREDAWQYLPETNPFLRRLFEDVSQCQASELGEELIDAISEVFSILWAAKMEAILLDFRQKMNREDIVIRFYEDFLAAYKPQMRERRGVYYTPEPVVSYMVRSVDELLKDKFNKPLGLADPEVMILDPACGTGTFLLWICQLIYQRFQESPDALTEGLADKSWSGYVKERLLPRIFGFELLMAPYAIAHLKLGLFLEETGYQFDGGKRLGVYLTNSLEQDAPDKPEIPFEEFIAQEGEAALDIKRNQPIMIIMGNPPYSSSNFEGEWIMNLMDNYKEGLSEKKSDLNREEWKFLRFAQEKIKKVGKGIISFVINNTFIDAITHWSLRKSLFYSFDEINILDLHGSIKKQEKSPDGSKDEGVFDIQQGVAVSIFIKSSETQNSTVAKHTDIWGLRKQKYNYLNKDSLKSTDWNILNPRQPHFFFSNRNLEDGKEFESYWSLDEIIKTHGSGVKTDRDLLFLDFDQDDLSQRMSIFYSNQCFEPSFVKEYRIENSSSYNLIQRRQDTKFDLKNIHSILYRPFDKRYIYYALGLTSRAAWEVMQHMLHPNFALIAKRQARENLPYTWFSVTDSLVIDGSFAIDNKGRERIFPLYLYPDTKNPQKSLLPEKRQPNISQDFLKDIANSLGYTPTPEAIFYYIYAIFHSPTYRTRYAEFLKIDFPRVPLTSDDKLFRQLATYGEELVALHLMKSPKLDNLITEFIETTGNRLVDAGHPRYSQGISRTPCCHCANRRSNSPVDGLARFH
ncbi:MAG: type ISP restriction/modification enzyme [Gloeotrichia echinulata GP01]